LPCVNGVTTALIQNGGGDPNRAKDFPKRNIKGGRMGIAEIIFVVLLAGGMFGSGIYVGIVTKKWFFFGVFALFFTCFGLMEWWSVAATGESISQTIWTVGESNPIGFWIMLVSLALAWGALLWHFAIKKIGKKKQKNEYDG